MLVPMLVLRRKSVVKIASVIIVRITAYSAMVCASSFLRSHVDDCFATLESSPLLDRRGRAANVFRGPMIDTS
jgi:hypothetical protein